MKLTNLQKAEKRYQRLMDEYMDRLVKHGSTLSSCARALEALNDGNLDAVEIILRMEITNGKRDQKN